jgi:hypothetical protein
MLHYIREIRTLQVLNKISVTTGEKATERISYMQIGKEGDIDVYKDPDVDVCGLSSVILIKVTEKFGGKE